jgi:hypothetical protein
MRKYFILLVFVSGFITVRAQIIYDYDNAGNRILKKHSGALPVTLISFTARTNSEGSTGLLLWQTSSELNSDSYDIERGQDGKKWVNIGKVVAGGETRSSSYYSFTDKSPMDGENLYRLKMIDKDRTFSFSRIESLTFDFDISFYPNPVSDFLKIRGLSQTKSPIKKTEVLNNYGTVVISRLSFPVDGMNVSSLPTGIYFLKTYHNDGSSKVKKVIKE